jgi:hypothetical protein
MGFLEAEIDRIGRADVALDEDYSTSPYELHQPWWPTAFEPVRFLTAARVHWFNAKLDFSRKTF